MSTSLQTSIAFACDEAAFRLKEAIRAYLEKLGHTVEDFGFYNTDPSLSPGIAEKVARAVADGKHSQGILMCGTGIGMAITANKVPGVPRISRTERCSSRASAFFPEGKPRVLKLRLKTTGGSECMSQ